MLLYGFVWFGQSSEAEVKTINEQKRLCSREWKRLWSGLVEIVKLNSKPLMKDHCRYRAARAAKNKTTKTKATNKHRQQTNKYHRQTNKQTQCNSLQYFYTLEYTHIPSHPWYHTKHATTSSLFQCIQSNYLFVFYNTYTGPWGFVEWQRGSEVKQKFG